MFSAPQGRAATTSLEGVPLITGFARSQLTGWIAAAGVAEATLTGPALKDMMIALSIGAIMLAIGLVFALRMAGQIARGEALHTLLINELNHRVRNTLATVQSMAIADLPQLVGSRGKTEVQLTAGRAGRRPQSAERQQMGRRRSARDHRDRA